VQDDSLAALLLAEKPARVVLVGEPVFRLESVINSAVRDASADAPAAEVSCNQQISELAELIVTSEPQQSESVLCLYLPADLASPGSVLGTACRASPKLVLIEHAQGSSKEKLLEDEQFFAFGFRKLGKAISAAGLKCSWYAYSLRDYKQAPDWLNARFWAHPERFNLLEP